MLKFVFGGFLAIGGLLVYQGSALAISIGTSLTASALISIATLMIDQVRNGEQVRMRELIDTGLIAAEKHRNLSEYDTLVANAKVIDVTGYTLKSFSEQNEAHFRKRAETCSPIKVRVLLVHPESEAAKIMEGAENLQPGQYAGSCNAVIKRLSGIDGVTIKLLRQHLSMMVYRIDETLYTGPYPDSGRSATAFTLKVGNGWLFDQQMEDFEALWKKAELAPPLSTI